MVLMTCSSVPLFAKQVDIEVELVRVCCAIQQLRIETLHNLHNVFMIFTFFNLQIIVVSPAIPALRRQQGSGAGCRHRLREYETWNDQWSSRRLASWRQSRHSLAVFGYNGIAETVRPGPLGYLTFGAASPDRLVAACLRSHAVLLLRRAIVVAGCSGLSMRRHCISRKQHHRPHQRTNCESDFSVVSSPSHLMASGHCSSVKD